MTDQQPEPQQEQAPEAQQSEPPKWVSVARPTVMSGLCIDWYRTVDQYEHGDAWTVSASREGVLIHDGVYLHTIRPDVLEQAEAVRQLLIDNHRDQARGYTTHEEDRSRGFGRGRLIARQEVDS